MKFCSQCAEPISKLIPEDDNKLRFVCKKCGFIHYQNPKIIAGCLPIWGEKVLLCKRAIEPRYGLWTLPAGFMENGETTEQGAMRECLEEAMAYVKIENLYCLYNIPQIHQVYIFYRATLLKDNFYPGPESLETQLFSEDEIPWKSLAFPAVKKTLKHYFEDRKQSVFPLHTDTITKPAYQVFRAIKKLKGD